MSFQKVYLEITNVCNLRCAFCHGTARAPRFLSPAEFDRLTDRLQGATRYLYFHLMGEPLLHPALPELLDIAGEKDFYVNLTTNAILLPSRETTLLSAKALHRVNLSLQAWEANAEFLPLYDYVNQCAAFAQQAAAQGILVSLRLWNGGAAAVHNDELLALLRAHFPAPWQPGQNNTVLAPRIFLEQADRFAWPDPEAPASGTHFCRGLRDHIGVLCDGTVVPCCLDAEGALALGNLFDQPLADILAGARARAIYDGFSRRRAVEPLCQHCGYAARFG